MSNIPKNTDIPNISKETQSLLKDVKAETEISTQVKIDSDLKVGTAKSIAEITKKAQPKEISGVINVDDTLKDDPDKKIKITFKGKNFIKDEINKKTADAPLEAIGVESSTAPKMLGAVEPSVEEIRDQIKKAESETKESFTADDYSMIAEFLIDTLDWGGSSALMYVAKDKTDAPYTLSVDKKTRLKKQLTRILIKSNVKMNFGVLFAISLILAYIKPIKMAVENRKLILDGEKEFKKKKAEKLAEDRRAEVERQQKLANTEEVIIEPKEKPIKKIVVEEIINDIKPEVKTEPKLTVIKEETKKETPKAETNAKGEEVLTPNTIVTKGGRVSIRRRRGSVK